MTGAPRPWPLSGVSEAEVRTQAARLAEQLRADPGRDPADLGYAPATADATGRHRAVVLGADRAELLPGLDALAAGSDHDRVVRGTVAPSGGVAMVVAGAGG